MGKINRKQFLEEVIATQVGERPAAGEDVIFNKYSNKTLPASYKSTTTLAQYIGEWTETQIRHLLRRTMFGVKEADVQTLLGMNMSDAVDYLLNNIPPAPAPPVNNYEAIGNTDITGVLAGETWVTAPLGEAILNDARRYSLKSWWVGQMLNQNLSIVEKMVFFWHNHFATQTYLIGDARLSYNHHVLLRVNALGNYKEFVKSISTDCAILMFLNGNLNTKYNPEENYARELQELFTIGKYNTPKYTEDDIKAAAKVLTGWRINDTTLASFFLPPFHDTSDKQFSSFYSNTIITGQAGANGANETDALIEMIFTKNETAHYLCTKLYRFFVYYNIDAGIDADIITPLSQLFIDNNFEIKPVLQTLLKSSHFFDPNTIGCYIKTPLDLAIGNFRTFNMSVPVSYNVIQTYALWNNIHGFCLQAGLDPGDAPNVAGWPQFYQSPAYYELWINSSTLPVRMAYNDALVATGLSAGAGTNVTIDILEFSKQYSNAGDPAALVSYFIKLFLGVPVSATEQANLKGILLSGQITDSYWTVAWGDYITNPTTENTSIVWSRIRALLTTILRLPEHQLC